MIRPPPRFTLTSCLFPYTTRVVSGDGLLAVDWFGERRGESENLDAESGFDGLDLVAEKPRQAFDVAHGQGRADADSLRDVDDAVTEQVGRKSTRLNSSH